MIEYAMTNNALCPFGTKKPSEAKKKIEKEHKC